MPTFLINGVTPASLGLAVPRVAEGNLSADVLTLDHLTAAWDADPIFDYAETLTLTLDGVIVFVGKVRRFPRFAGPTAETTSYEVLGPWDWLERRMLEQNQAVYPDTGVGPPAMVPQGLIILGQDDTGNTVQISQALTTIIQQAIDIGVPILLGDIVGFDYAMAWDEVADLTHADAIVRLLASAPDAVVHWDYTTTSGGEPTPTIHIGRRANLSEVSLAIAMPGATAADFAAGTYAPFETVRITSRPDLVATCSHITYRRINTVNGESFLKLENQTAGPGAKTDENALVRTVQLAGSSEAFREVEQECVAAIIPVRLAGPGEVDAITPAAGADFTAVLKFLGRVHGWLLSPDTTVEELKPRGTHSELSAVRRGLKPDPETGEMIEVEADTSLVRELVEGGITSWMEVTGLNRKGQEQEVCYEVKYTRLIDGVSKPFVTTITRAFMATNVSTRTYRHSEAGDSEPPEPTPEGFAAALYAAMSVLQHEGRFTLVERECSFSVRPGMVVNLTGARAEWATMKAVVQSVVHDLTSGRTEVTIGWPRHITAAELMSILRSNRLKRSADRGLNRTTGKF